jgi:hypothetical protein
MLLYVLVDTLNLEALATVLKNPNQSGVRPIETPTDRLRQCPFMDFPVSETSAARRYIPIIGIVQGALAKPDDVVTRHRPRFRRWRAAKILELF